MESYSLQKLIPAFRELNDIYNNILSAQSVSYFSQKNITDFYGANGDERLFEGMLIECLHTKGKEVFHTSTAVLIDLIKKNIDLYKDHETFFSSVDTHNICHSEERRFDAEIKEQLDILKPISDDLARLEGLLESASLDNDKAKTLAVEKKMRAARTAYNKEKKILESLYAKKGSLSKDVAQYSRNIFMGIFSLGQSYANILLQYSKTETTGLKENATRPLANRDRQPYFDPVLLSKIYLQCNEQQFEKMDVSGFFDFFNLYSGSAPKIREREITRVYYLINKMSGTLEGETKKTWLEAIIQHLQIDNIAYGKKNTQCSNPDQGTKNRKFAKEIDTLFDTL